MSSLYRVVLAAVFAVVSVFAFNAYADNTNQAQAANQAATPAATAPAKAAHHRAAAAPVNINTADAAALAKVRGIGPKKAQAIIAYRSKNGQFQAVTDLKNVTNAKGKAMFTDAALDRLQKRLTV